MKKERTLSVVVPIFNEEDTLPELYRRLVDALDVLEGFKVEIVFVDDGSKDSSASIIEKFHESDKRVKMVQFSRNFGHHMAATAGLDNANGEIIVLMDGDLQNRPEDIPALLQKIDEGYDLVSTTRKERQDPLIKMVLSKMFIWLMGKVIKEPVSIVNTSIFRAMRREVVDVIGEIRERNRFVMGLIDWTGFRSTSIEVIHDNRFAGTSKYTLSKQIKLALDAIYSFSTFPLQLAATLGFIVTGASFLYGFYVIVRKLIWGFTLPGFASLTVSVFFIGGVQLIVLGVIGSYIGRIYTEVK
ncbi:MAG: glycosyltransferase family 2 protein, partial [Parcubacteria group bacterium]|nr:glycosyltransferase family 2 protein [Parcubacteria group bacterium]